MGGDVAPNEFEAPKGFSMSLTMKSEADAERIFNEPASPTSSIASGSRG